MTMVLWAAGHCSVVTMLGPSGSGRSPLIFTSWPEGHPDWTGKEVEAPGQHNNGRTGNQTRSPLLPGLPALRGLCGSLRPPGAGLQGWVVLPGLLGEVPGPWPRGLSIVESRWPPCEWLAVRWGQQFDGRITWVPPQSPRNLGPLSFQPGGQRPCVSSSPCRKWRSAAARRGRRGRPCTTACW